MNIHCGARRVVEKMSFELFKESGRYYISEVDG